MNWLHRLVKSPVVWMLLGLVGVALIVGAVVSGILAMFLGLLWCSLPDSGCPLEATPSFGWLIIGIALVSCSGIGIVLTRRARRMTRGNLTHDRRLVG